MGSFTHDVPGFRRVRISFETKTGDFKNRYVEIWQGRDDTDSDLRVRAANAYRQKYGERTRIVAIDI